MATYPENPPEDAPEPDPWDDPEWVAETDDEQAAMAEEGE